MRTPVVSFAISVFLAGPAVAQDESEVDIFAVRDEVAALAFDPARFFPSQYVGDASMLRITYIGDDYAWPVYSIAVAASCQDDERDRPEQCRNALRARMVRGPAPDNMTRPRHRGSSLVRAVADQVAEMGQSTAAALSVLGVDWLEADVRTCPGALESLARSVDAEWVPDALANAATGLESLEIVLHADHIAVEVEQYRRISTYDGRIAPGSPAEWANAFAEVLEPCWRSASVPPPWTRPLQADEQADGRQE